MQLLFDRRARVVIHELELTGLRMAFQVERSLKKSPNTAEVRIWNLNRDHRRALQQQSRIPVLLQAGYLRPPLSAGTEAILGEIGLDQTSPSLPTLFYGDLRRAFTSRDGSDWVTTISSGDGEKASQNKRVKLQFRPGLRWRQILRDLAKEAGVGLGNALSAIEGMADIQISTGLSLSGSALDNLERMLAGGGFEVSVQDGELQVLGAGKALQDTAVLLSEGTGLVESPEPANDGRVKVTALLQPGLEPGRRVRLEAEQVQGYFRVERVTYVGDTHEQDWYAELEIAELRR